MPGTILVGSQWGDEGKGKATDLLADRMDVVVRQRQQRRAHGDRRGPHLQAPPGPQRHPLRHPGDRNGMVVDPGTLLAELAALDAQGIATGKLLISANAHLIMPWHKERRVHRALARPPAIYHRLGHRSPTAARTRSASASASRTCSTRGPGQEGRGR